MHMRMSEAKLAYAWGLGKEAWTRCARECRMVQSRHQRRLHALSLCLRRDPPPAPYHAFAVGIRMLADSAFCIRTPSAPMLVAGHVACD